jgi:hypothetical protein
MAHPDWHPTSVLFHLHGVNNGQLDAYCPNQIPMYALSFEYADDVSPSHL